MVFLSSLSVRYSCHMRITGIHSLLNAHAIMFYKVRTLANISTFPKCFSQSASVSFIVGVVTYLDTTLPKSASKVILYPYFIY